MPWVIKMPIEIERKFLVNSNAYKENAQKHEIKQVYLSATDKMAIRVRIDGIQATLAIKSKESERINREYEYMIPMDEAISLVKLQDFPTIIKTRHVLEHEGHTWEVDEFHGKNRGLIVAEIELNNENEEFKIPSWIEKEVTSDYRYLNSNLALNPFSQW